MRLRGSPSCFPVGASDRVRLVSCDREVRVTVPDIQAAQASSAVAFDLPTLLKQRGDERYELHQRLLNPQLVRTLHAIGFDRTYVRGERAYLYHEQGRQY